MGEYLLNNRLDAEFQRMLFPLNLMQGILLQPKYTTLQGFVTPNGYLTHLQCLLGSILVISINAFKWWMQSLDKSETDFTSSVTIFDTVFYGAYTLIISVVNIAQNKNNVLLILKMQQAYRLFGCEGGLTKHRNGNWMNIVGTLFMCVVFVSFNYLNNKLDYPQILFVMSLFYFDGNIVFAVQVLKFLNYETKQWLKEIDRFLVKCSETDHNELTKYLKEINLHEIRLYQAYLDIMEAYKLYNSIFQYSILLLAVEVFIHPLIYIQSFLDLIRVSDNADGSSIAIVYTLIPSLWVVKNLTLLIFLSVTSQQFYLSISEVDKACAIVRSQYGSLYILSLKKLCKKVWRVNASVRAARGLRAGGVLAVGAALPLRLLALLATYTVVLLQFAFL